MSVYLTEEEQIEAIKKWWARYGNLCLWVILFIFIALTAYRYWFLHEEKMNIEASFTYERLMKAVANHHTEEIKIQGDILSSQYLKTPYADAARLLLARFYVEQNQFENARRILGEILAHPKNSVLQDLASIRMARLDIYEKKLDAAENLLSSLKTSLFSPMVHELQGDLLVLKGQDGEALKAYQTALNEIRMQGIFNGELEMKISELSGSLST